MKVSNPIQYDELMTEDDYKKIFGAVDDRYR